MKVHLNNYRYEVYLLLLWIIAFVVILPIGEFAINDDWAYAKNVYKLTVNGKFTVDEWPAMNLISQTFYGFMTTSLFGFSLTTLRVSIFSLSICSSLFLFRLLKHLSGNNKFVAFVFTASFVFNPIYMHLSMTYMTEVFFISMLIFALNSLVNYRMHSKLSSYIWFCFWCIAAMLCRQQALLFGALIIPFVINQNMAIWKKFLMSILPIYLCWKLSEMYRDILSSKNISHNIQRIDDLTNYLKNASIEKHILQASDILLLLGGTLLPISIFLMLSHIKLFRRKNALWFLIASLIAIFSTVSAFGIYPIGNISKLFEIGPRLIKGASERFNGDSYRLLHQLFYFVSVSSLSIVILFIIKKRTLDARQPKKTIEKAVYLIIAFSYLTFGALNNAYFDRYSLPLFLTMLLVLVPQNFTESLTSKLITTILVLIIFTLGLVENLDYFNWQKQRAKAIQHLYKIGVSANEIDGGFEFNGWTKENNIYPSDPSKSWWWVVDDKFIISANPLYNTHLKKYFVYQRYLPFEQDTVFLLEKNQ